MLRFLAVFQFLVESNKLLTELMFWYKVNQWARQAVRFTDLDGGRELGGENRLSLCAEFIYELLWKFGARLKLIDDNPFDGQLWIMVFTDFRERLDE